MNIKLRIVVTPEQIEEYYQIVREDYDEMQDKLRNGDPEAYHYLCLMSGAINTLGWILGKEEETAKVNRVIQGHNEERKKLGRPIPNGNTN